MFQLRLRWFFLISGILLLISCSILQPGQQTLPLPNTPAEKTTPLPTLPAGSSAGYNNQDLSFSPPGGWTIHEGPTATGQTAWNYKHLNLKIIVEIKGSAPLPLVTIASHHNTPHRT